jgi:hypothetical protein
MCYQANKILRQAEAYGEDLTVKVTEFANGDVSVEQSSKAYVNPLRYTLGGGFQAVVSVFANLGATGTVLTHRVANNPLRQELSDFAQTPGVKPRGIKLFWDPVKTPSTAQPLPTEQAIA